MGDAGDPHGLCCAPYADIGIMNQFVKQGAVIVRRIHEAGTSRHVDGICRGPIISAVFGGAVEIERGAALPSGDDALAEFVFVNFRRNGRLRDFRQRETVALLHIENRVMAENERNALILPGRVFVLLRIFGKLLIKDNRCSMLAFADAAFQCLRLLEGKPEQGAIFTRPKQQNIDAMVGFAGVEVAREWPACEAWRLPRLLPRNHACLEAKKNAVGNGLVDAGPAGCIAMVALCHDVCSPVLPPRGEILKEGISPLALNQISFVECPRFMSCAVGKGEAGSVKGGCTVPVYGPI